VGPQVVTQADGQLSKHLWVCGGDGCVKGGGTQERGAQAGAKEVSLDDGLTDMSLHAKPQQLNAAAAASCNPRAPHLPVTTTTQILQLSPHPGDYRKWTPLTLRQVCCVPGDRPQNSARPPVTQQTRLHPW
jgi:hypothetical protein